MTAELGKPDDPDSIRTAIGREARKAILAMLDFANLEAGFPRIVQWFGAVPAADRDRLLQELEAIAVTDPVRREAAEYLLEGLRGTRWDSSGSSNTARLRHIVRRRSRARCRK